MNYYNKSCPVSVNVLYEITEDISQLCCEHAE